MAEYSGAISLIQANKINSKLLVIPFTNTTAKAVAKNESQLRLVRSSHPAKTNKTEKISTTIQKVPDIKNVIKTIDAKTAPLQTEKKKNFFVSLKNTCFNAIKPAKLNVKPRINSTKRILATINIVLLDKTSPLSILHDTSHTQKYPYETVTKNFYLWIEFLHYQDSLLFHYNLSHDQDSQYYIYEF